MKLNTSIDGMVPVKLSTDIDKTVPVKLNTTIDKIAPVKVNTAKSLSSFCSEGGCLMQRRRDRTASVELNIDI